jgi:CspA family cold shock protein
MRAAPPIKVRGRVKWFNARIGVGFITTAEGEDIFVHRGGIAGPPALVDGQTVEFEIVPNKKGRRAVNVTVV